MALSEEASAARRGRTAAAAEDTSRDPAAARRKRISAAAAPRSLEVRTQEPAAAVAAARRSLEVQAVERRTRAAAPAPRRTACHRPSFYLEATTPRRHRGRRFLGTRLNATRRRGRRDTRTARRRRALGRILGRGRRTTRARRRGLLSESLPAKFWIRMLLCHQSTRV